MIYFMMNFKYRKATALAELNHFDEAIENFKKANQLMPERSKEIYILIQNATKYQLKMSI